MASPIRVLIVDDSSYVRMVVSRMLGRAHDIEVVGQAADGQDALQMALALKPDVITLDVEMPKLNGLEVLRRLLPREQIPVVMLSSLTQARADVTLQALELGAVDFVGKPGSAGVPDIAAVEYSLLMKVRAAAGARVLAPLQKRGFVQAVDPAVSPQIRRQPTLLMASSTGGPGTVANLLAALPPDLPARLALTQHMPASFTQSFAARLDAECELEVREAAEGDMLHVGTVLLAPGDWHMIIGPQGIIHLSNAELVWGVRPAADPMMQSAAENLREPLIGLVLTGMGCDGADGLRSIKHANGVAIAQDEQSSVIYGMPKAAAETGICDHIAPLDKLPELIVKQIYRLATAQQPVAAIATAGRRQ
jgi:two-component system, chemotaxis family, protein-glutamate methylesterase/glutaminase